MKKKQEPIDINKEANHTLVAGLVAHFQANKAAEVGSVAEPHLRRISFRFFSVSRFLDKLLEANERANDKR